MHITNDYSHLSPESNYGARLAVSIVVLYRDRPDLIASLFASIGAQQYPHALLEVVIIDDDSNRALAAGQLELLRDIRCRVKHVPDHRTYRLSTLRNIGVEFACGDVVVCVDQDVICSPMFIESHLSWFHVDRAVATFGLRRFIDTRAFMDPPPHTYRQCMELPDVRSASNGQRIGDVRKRELEDILTHAAPYNCFHGCNIAFSRDDAINIGLFDTAFNGGFGYEDIEFGSRLWQAGAFIVFEQQAIVLHQENDVITYEFRTEYGSRNRRLLFRRCPALKQVRQQYSKAADTGITMRRSGARSDLPS